MRQTKNKSFAYSEAFFAGRPALGQQGGRLFILLVRHGDVVSELMRGQRAECATDWADECFSTLQGMPCAASSCSMRCASSAEKVECTRRWVNAWIRLISIPPWEKPYGLRGICRRIMRTGYLRKEKSQPAQICTGRGGTGVENTICVSVLPKCCRPPMKVSSSCVEG